MLLCGSILALGCLFIYVLYPQDTVIREQLDATSDTVEKESVSTRLDEDVIDRELQACMDTDPSTTGTVQCIYSAREKYEVEINRIYNELKLSIRPDHVELLDQSQIEYLSYRESESKLAESIYSSLDGTMYGPQLAMALLTLSKNRSEQLNRYLSALGE